MRPTQNIPPELVQKLTTSGLRGIYKLELRGDDGGTWYLRCGDDLEVAERISDDEHPDVIVRTDRGDLTALLEGRMSVSDGLVSERLSLVGDITKIAALQRAIVPERRS